jgi:hypothetical protein
MRPQPSKHACSASPPIIEATSKTALFSPAESGGIRASTYGPHPE